MALTENDLEEAIAGADLIVNSTSIGMSHGDAEGRTPLEARLIPASALVYDMVYNPSETPLLREARRAGARTLGGPVDADIPGCGRIRALDRQRRAGRGDAIGGRRGFGRPVCSGLRVPAR